jgi:hypothetical protein
MAPMQLTAEQHQVVEAAEGTPVQVVDPQTRQTYVLLRAELYERLRDLLEREQAAEPRAAPATSAAPERPPTRVKLRDLPMPAEVAQAVTRHCQKLGLWRRKYVRQVEEELKLQYHFGGQYVACLPSGEGPVVVAVGSPGSEEFGRQLDALPLEERRQVTYLVPTIWNDPSSALLTPFAHKS